MSRFDKSFVCLNGPKEGTWIDAPADADVGTACAIPWIDAKGIIRFAVYLVHLIPNDEQDTTMQGLMFVKSHDTTERAQHHVTELSLVMQAAKQTVYN